MSKKLLFKGGHATGMIPFEIEDFSTLYMMDARVDEKTKAYIDSVIGNSVLNLCPYRNVLVTHKYDTVEGNVVTLDDCQDDEIIQLSEIQGNTMVNCNKDTDKELILMPNLDSNGYSNITLTEGTDGGKVDIALEGNTMVNVCDQEDPVAITKSYTVETGNHVALQGEYDGKCRPNIYGNTLVNLVKTIEHLATSTAYYNRYDIHLSYAKENCDYTVIFNADFEANNTTEMGWLNNTWADKLPNNTVIKGFNKLKLTNTTGSNLLRIKLTDTNKLTVSNLIILEGDYTNKPIPDYFTGMQSSFEDKLITDEKDAHNGKYKVDYKVTGKNKFDINNEFTTPITAGKEYITVNGNTTTITPASEVNIRKYFKIKVSPNTTYNINGIISHGMIVIYKHSINTDTFIWDTSYIHTFKNYTKQENVTLAVQFTTGADEHEVYVGFSNESVSETSIFTNIQLEEGTTATTYEPYKESIKTLYLNSPLLEGDTIEQSGNDIVHMHKYKTVTFDGSDDEKWVYWGNNTDNGKLDSSLISFYLPFTNYKDFTTSTIFNNKFLMANTVWGATTEIMALNADNIMSFQVALLRSKLATQDLAGFKTWLQANPITVAYELATPTQEIISTNDNLLLDSYANGHLDVDSVIPIDKVVFQGNFNKSLRYLYPNTEYIIQFESNNSGKIDKLHLAGTNSDIFNVVKGVNKYTLTTGELSSKSIVINGIGFNMSKIVVTPKVEQPFGYFKGMKSVGECEGNKIEILSRNKNLFYGDIEMGFINDINGKEMGWNEYFRCKEYIPCKPDTRYISTFKYSDELKYCYLLCYDKNKEFISGIKSWELSKQKTPIGCAYIRIAGQCINSGVVVLSNISEILINEDTATDYIPHAENKKEILLSEPLRGLPNGVKDKYVIIDGKWYIERNINKLKVNNEKINQVGFGTDIEGYSKWKSVELECLLNNSTNGDYNTETNFICDTYITKANWNIKNIVFIEKNTLCLVIPNKYNAENIHEHINSLNIIYQLKTPTYEPIDYNPFEIYTDITHISNNSIIPCNMVIKNTGYNCILKPNTKYTVSSSNGLSTVTTKDSIGDGILRFYDKDTTSVTKMSNVLVLEGDYITGNPPIPAFFKGMESAFEQELVTDENDEHYGKYKVEVLANNGNLLNGENIKAYGSVTNNNGVFTTAIFEKDYGWFRLKLINSYKLEPGTYYFQFKMRSDSCKGSINEIRFEEIADKKYLSYTEKIINPSCNTDYQVYELKYVVTKTLEIKYIFIQGSQTSSSSLQFKEFALSRTRLDSYIPYAINKIQFLLNEPLRGVGNVKDKVYVKEDKVVVERNCYELKINRNCAISLGNNYDNYNTFMFRLYFHRFNNNFPSASQQFVHCNTISWSTNNIWTTDKENVVVGDLQTQILDFRINKNKLSSLDVEGFYKWLENNPTTVVYQLATPVYEEVECDLSKLALEGYNHGTLFYNSNIPVTTQFYDFKVNIKDMLIPNETYYVTFNADRVKDITINLSGVQVNYKTSMGYNKVPIQLGDVVNTNFSMDSRGVELSDLMVSTSTSLIYVKDMNDVCVYDEATNKYSITITSTNGKESDKRVILLDYPLLRLNKDIYDRLYYSNKDSRYRIDKKVFKHKFTNDHEYSKYAAETNDTYYSSFISLNEAIKDYVVITNEKVKTVKVEDDKYYFKIKWSDLGVSDKTEANGNQGVKDFFNNNEVYLYYATDGFVEIVDGLRRQTLKVYQPETFMKFLGNTTTTVIILIPMKNV